MSTLMMFRRCEHRYAYNPSTGNLGLVYPKCKKAQSVIVSSQSQVDGTTISSLYLEKVIDFVNKVDRRK